MESRAYASRLRYLDAHDVDDGVVDFDGLDVTGLDGAKLGTVDGFIVDLASERVLYIVIDSGGWFRSRRFLVPIGHAVVDQGRRALSLDITREALHEYPEFDEARFSAFSDADLHAFETRMTGACCPEEPPDPLDDAVGSGSEWAYGTRRHYRQPAWWRGSAFARLRPVESPAHRLLPDILDPVDVPLDGERREH